MLMGLTNRHRKIIYMLNKLFQKSTNFEQFFFCKIPLPDLHILKLYLYVNVAICKF